MKIFRTIFTVLLSLGLCCACDDEKIEINTREATNITSYEALVICDILSEDISWDDADYGILYSTSKSDLENGAGFEAISSNFDGSSFSATISFSTLDGWADPGTKYYYRGYLYDGSKIGGWYYGNIRSIRVPSRSESSR